MCDIMSRLYPQEITEDIADLEVETHRVLALLERKGKERKGKEISSITSHDSVPRITPLTL